MNQNIQEQYIDPSLPGSYLGLETFYRALRNRNVRVKKIDVKKWLMSKGSYTLHYLRRIKFKRNKVIVSGIDDTWQGDLADMKNISEYNSGFKYIFVCIDVFSKHAWVTPTKEKTGPAVTKAFLEIIEKAGRKPKQLQTDDGTEFLNSSFQDMLKEKNINFYTVRSENKACIAERFVRTLKTKLYRYFSDKNDYRYIDDLDKFLDSYNSTFHRTIKMAPKDVNNENESELWKKLFLYKKEDSINFKFIVGDNVRISFSKKCFEKGYTPKWTEEIFTIAERLPRCPPVYIIKDYHNKKIDGIFYEKELQKVIITNEIYKIEKILKYKTVNKIKCAFVKWYGYSEKFNSWVLASDIHTIKR